MTRRTLNRLALAFGFSPLFGLLLLWILEALTGCSFLRPCMIGGTDWSGFLGALNVGGWFFFYTLPLSFILLAVIAKTHR